MVPLLVSAESHGAYRGPGTPPENIVARFGCVPRGVSTAVSVNVIANRGRWLVRCPGCLSAQYAARSDKRFYCVECNNDFADCQWVTVVWPVQVREIESLLAKRPKDARNWNGESVDSLRLENSARGL